MKNLALSFLLIVLAAVTCFAQTSAFTYQGKLGNGGVPASGDYQFEFKLFDASGSTNQVGSTQTVIANVQNGAFTTRLDFGTAAFPSGADRWLEISVRLNASGDPYTVLSPRQQISSVPFAVRSLQATNADSATLAENVTGVVQASNGGTGLGGPPPAAGTFLRSNGSGWTASGIVAADVPSGSTSYVQNGTTPQTSNFNITGDGTVGGTLKGNVVNATTQFNINGQGILRTGTNSDLYVGLAAGPPNFGGFNTFVGTVAGAANNASSNSFFGAFAGTENTTGSENSFFGTTTGQTNTTGNKNSFFGSSAGRDNSTGFQNSFFGAQAGKDNTTGVTNSFFGTFAGFSNTTGSANAFFGEASGSSNTSGNSLSFFGMSSGSANTSGIENSFFGRASGGANISGHQNSFFGAYAGQTSSTGDANSFFGLFAGASNTTGSSNTAVGARADLGSDNLSFATAIGAGAVVSTSNTIALGRSVDTVVVPGNLNVAGNINGTFNGTIATANNALNLGGVAANQYVVTSDPRMTDARDPLAGSTNYIQNIPGIGTQSGSFNIDGGASANIFNATTQYNIGGSRVLSTAGTSNLFAGMNAGLSNTTGFANSFFGTGAGLSNTTGFGNAFVGTSAGQNNTTGNSNSFVGGNAGLSNTTGFDNSFVGRDAGQLNTTGNENSFFGSNAGRGNTTGSSNSFVGTFAGLSNTTGFGNSFVGRSAGQNNTTGDNNSFIGAFTGLNNTTGNNNSFVGSNAGLSNTTGNDNSLVGVNAGASNTTGFENAFFGHDVGSANTTGNTNSFFGKGAGSGNTEGYANSFFGRYAGFQNTTGYGNTMIGNGANVGFNNLFNATAIGVNAVVSQSNSLVLGAFGATLGDTRVGIGTSAPGYKLDVVGRSRFKQERDSTGTAGSAGFWLFQNTPNDDRAFVGMENDDSVGLYGNNGGNWGLVMNTQTGVTSVRALGAGGSTSLCRNANNEISTCSSSIRYKRNIYPFSQGLALIKQLHPVSFNWRANNQADFGLVAEDVAKVEPLLAATNEKGEIEGVKYDRVGVVLINAVQEQQRQIEAQQKQIYEQREQIEALKAVVCLQNPTAEICKPKN